MKRIRRGRKHKQTEAERIDHEFNMILWTLGRCEECGEGLSETSLRYCMDCEKAYSTSVHFISCESVEGWREEERRERELELLHLGLSCPFAVVDERYGRKDKDGKCKRKA